MENSLNRLVDIDKMIENYNKRYPLGFIVISELVFERILSKASNYLLSQSKLDEVIRALKRIYYDGTKVLTVFDELDGVSHFSVRAVFQKALTEEMGEMDAYIRKMFYQYKKVNMKTVWSSGRIIATLRAKNKNLKDWCDGNSVFLI